MLKYNFFLEFSKCLLIVNLLSASLPSVTGSLFYKLKKKKFLYAPMSKIGRGRFGKHFFYSENFIFFFPMGPLQLFKTHVILWKIYFFLNFLRVINKTIILILCKIYVFIFSLYTDFMVPPLFVPCRMWSSHNHGLAYHPWRWVPPFF